MATEVPTVTMSDKSFLLAVLSDRREHRLSEILRRSLLERGHGMTVHSRAADLRRDGFDIACWPVKGGRDSFYQLIADASPLESATQGLRAAGENPRVAGSSVDAEASRDVPPVLTGHAGGTVESVASTLDSQPSLFPTAPGAYDREAA